MPDVSIAVGLLQERVKVWRERFKTAAEEADRHHRSYREADYRAQQAEHSIVRIEAELLILASVSDPDSVPLEEDPLDVRREPPAQLLLSPPPADPSSISIIGPRPPLEDA